MPKEESIDVQQARMDERIKQLEQSDQVLFRKIDELPQKIAEIITEKMMNHQAIEESKFQAITVRMDQVEHKMRNLTMTQEILDKTIEKFKTWWSAIVFILASLAAVLQWVAKLLFVSH